MAPPDLLDFSGKVVLVTGSSRGIGAEMIKAFSERGAHCVVNFISDPAGQNKQDAGEVAGSLKDPLVIDCDVTQPGQVEAMMQQIQEKHGGLDVLVNNSGIIRDRTMKKMTLEEFESVVRVNLAGLLTSRKKRPAFCAMAVVSSIFRRSADRWDFSARPIIPRAKPPSSP